MNDGAYPGITFAEYAAAEGLNQSLLRVLIERSPMHLHAERVVEKDSALMRLGSMVHSVLADGNFGGVPTLAIKPKGMTFTTTEGKAWRQQQRKEGRLIVTESEYVFLAEAASAVTAHPFAKRLFEMGTGEISLFATDPIFKLPCKGRIDYDTPGDIIVDFKTSDSASKDAFRKSVRRFGYDLQSEWYRRLANQLGMQKKFVVFVVIERKPPYAVGCYRIGEATLAKAKLKLDAALASYASCTELGVWPGYSEDCEVIDL